MTNNPAVIGAGGALVGLLFGVVLGNAMIDTKVREGVRNGLARSAESMTSELDVLKGLDARLGALEEQSAQSAQASAALADTVSAQLAELSDASAAATTNQSQMFDDAIAKLQEQLGALGEPSGATAATVAAGAGESAAEETEAGPTVALSTDGPTYGVGQTAIFADGGVRAFVSSVGEDSAVVSINTVRHTLAMGAAVMVEGCTVGLAGIVDGAAALTGECGAEASDEAVDEIEGHAPGETVVFGDGAMRVFVSGVVDGVARLAVNGVELQNVEVGESLETADGACTVTVTDVGRSNVALEGECG